MMFTKDDPRASFKPAEDGDFFSLRDVLQAMRRRALTIVLVATLLAGAAVGFSLLQTPEYQASTKVLVGQEQRDDESFNLAGDVQGLQQIALTVAEAVNSRVVAEAVIEELGLPVTSGVFMEHMDVQPVTDTQFIEISYRDDNPERAQEVANTISKVSAARISEVSPSANAITATVWEAAGKPNAPVSPDPLRNGVLALALGLLLGTGLAFLLEHLDDTWHSPEELEQISGVPTFGIVPEFKVPRAKR